MYSIQAHAQGGGGWGYEDSSQQPKMYQKGPHCLHVKQKQARLLIQTVHNSAS